MRITWFFISFIFLAGCAEKEITKLDVEMFNASGDSLGNITLTEQSSGVKMDVNLSGLPAGEHAIHIHDKASCKAPDFKSAGGPSEPR